MLLAYGLRGSTGFGGAVGMPLLALVLPIKILIPVWTLLGFASSVAILGRDRRHVARRDFIAFLPWCVLGIAIGLYLFKTLGDRVQVNLSEYAFRRIVCLTLFLCGIPLLLK